MTHIHIVVMGVCGCGKTTVAHAVAEKLGWPFAEGDALHPQGNKDKMSAGIPLTDDDRWPWLDLIVDWTTREDLAGYSTVVTCSALKKSYRERLAQAPGVTFFVHLDGTPQLLASRMTAREGHFMPATLLPSQLATLERLAPGEAGIVVDIDSNVETIVDTIMAQLAQRKLIGMPADS